MGGSITHRILYRSVALFLCLALILPYFPHMADTVKAAEGEKTYEEEKAERAEEYNEKFNMSTLTWSEDSARPYLYWQDNTFGGIPYHNKIHVFAYEGDTICFGSNVDASILDIDGTGYLSNNANDQEKVKQQLGEGASVDIVLEDLDGNRLIYDVKKDGAGHIPNVQTEVLAKTMESVNGNERTVGTENYTYTPLTYTVHETGVYTIEFHSRDKGGTEGQARKNEDDFFRGTPTGNQTIDNAQGVLVAAWDVSVFNEQGYKETGRVYADSLTMQEYGALNIEETYYVLTSDSYIYKWDFNGVVPNTYGFFANNQGLLDNATGNILYKSVKAIDNGKMNDYNIYGVNFTFPGTPDTDLVKSFKIFFERPDSELEGELYDKAVAPDPAENLRFVTKIPDPDDDTGQTKIPGTYVDRGGYFAFDVKNATTASLVLEFKGQLADGEKSYAPVEISGVVRPYSTNYFYWDGRDGDGKIIPTGTYNIEDIIWTVTTKAGEIHFPFNDMEYAAKGFTITRISHIYDGNGNILDADAELSPGANASSSDNIYTATRSVVYYNSSNVFYGEKTGITGIPEDEIDLTNATGCDGENYMIKNRLGWKNTPSDGTSEGHEDGKFYAFNESTTVGGITGSELTAYNNYYDKMNLASWRIGDHSHTSHVINYYNGNDLVNSITTEQKNIISWLDSKEHPVGIAANGDDGITTLNSYVTENIADYGIQNYWTFVPGRPVTATDNTETTIRIIDGKVFNLTGLVFYDNSPANGKYNPQSDMDTVLEDVTVNLYKKTKDEEPQDGKTYITVAEDENGYTKSPATTFELGDEVYELLDTGKTTIEGRYVFNNIKYAETEGTEFVYEVVRPDSSWSVTSAKTKASPLSSTAAGEETYYGNYALYAYDEDSFGTELQKFTVGGEASGNIDPEKNLSGVVNHTVTAVDVGYNYNAEQSLKAVKSWATKEGEAHPENVVFELSYYTPDAAFDAERPHVYEEHSLSSIMSWEEAWNYLPDTIDDQKVQYYISAEYYLVRDGSGEDGGTLYKHTFDLDTTASNLTYNSFVGKAYSRKLTADQIASLDYGSYESLNGETEGWEEASSAPYTAVLDRNPGTAETVITITNSDDPGVIEILKYTGSLEDENYLQGATFRLYTDTDGVDDITLEGIKELVDRGNSGDLATLAAMQVGSGSTRDNGRMTFAGLDPGKHYVIREVYPPAGYRAREVLYMVHPAACKSESKENH